MNNLITITDFVGDYSISLGKNRQNQFTEFIAKRQEYYLIYFLGIDLYDALAASPTDQKWIDFLNGKDFISVETGYKRKYIGFKEILTKIVFSDWVIFSRNFFNETGAFMSDNENSTKLNITQLKNISRDSYNEAVNDVRVMYDFLLSNQTDYTNFYTFFNLLIPKGNLIKTVY